MKKILYYCGWGGFGHIARAYSIAKFLDFAEVTVISAEKWIFPKLPNLEYVEMSEPKSRFRLDGEKIILQNYGEKSDAIGYRKHLFEFFDLLKKIEPDLVIIDNPAELAIYAKMLGFKTLIVYETLKSEDLRWRLAWDNVDKIIVPYTKEFALDLNFKHEDNALFAGGYTRFEDDERNRKQARIDLKILDNEKLILLAVGKGKGGGEVAEAIASKISKLKKYRIIFPYFVPDVWLSEFQQLYPTIEVVSGKTDLSPYLAAADIFIGGAGFNTLMEACQFQVPAIFLPLDRIYGEQYNKAKTIARLGAGRMVMTTSRGWLGQIEKEIKDLCNPKVAAKMREAQRRIVDDHGARRVVHFIKEII
ncbi:MAG: glycosyltransferase [Candidatus Berkelbacteria bacterium]|nr:glycosyltransferase [Candidatus Berkelbacteria bacterium]